MSKPLTILYDSQMFNLQKYGGITRYFCNLVIGINNRPDTRARLPLVLSTNYYVRNFPQLLNNRIGRFLLKTSKKRNEANLLFTRFQIRKGNHDIVHATYYDPYFLNDLKKPLVITVHDMIHENYPHMYQQAEDLIGKKREMMEKSSLIIAISEYTRLEILKYYPQYEQKVRVIYHGLPKTQLTPSSENLPSKFIFYIGDRTARYKNFENMSRAIAPILNQQEDLHLICAGGGEFNHDENQLFDELGINAQTFQINASDSLVKQLYMQALVFIYPSLEEGFGFPMLEAFKNGCSIACSDKSCLPEVGGNAAAYFDPESATSIQETVSELLDNPDLRNKYINNGYEQLKKFTFDKCLNETIACYKSLIG